jgi:hypothetical protein
MVLPGLLAIAVPVVVGFGGKWFGIGGAEMLGGLLAGVTTCGVLMAIFQSNAGGAWDNAKKMIEEQGKKGTDAHKAAVVGDTVGDPFKDTSGPSLNILLKLMSVVALVIAPSLKNTADINNSMELTNTEQEAVIYEKVESEEIVIYSSASEFNINKSNNVTQLTNLLISNDMFCQSGGAACDQFASSCNAPLVFTSNGSVAVSRIDAYSYQIDGNIKVSSTDQSEATVYYDVVNDDAITGQVVFNDMTLKFKGKK